MTTPAVVRRADPEAVLWRAAAALLRSRAVVVQCDLLVSERRPYHSTAWDQQPGIDRLEIRMDLLAETLGDLDPRANSGTRTSADRLHDARLVAAQLLAERLGMRLVRIEVPQRVVPTPPTPPTETDGNEHWRRSIDLIRNMQRDDLAASMRGIAVRDVPPVTPPAPPPAPTSPPNPPADPTLPTPSLATATVDDAALRFSLLELE